MALRQISILSVLALTLVGAVAASLALGAVHVPLDDVIDALTGGAGPGPLNEIVLNLRLPRTVSAVIVGAALGVAGALLQGGLGNPLASPDVIGVTGGAGFGAVLILLVFPDAVALLPVGALFFGTLAALLVLGIAWTGPSGGGVSRLILAGIAIGSLFAAATTSVMVANSEGVQSALFFLAGGLSTDGWSPLEVTWPYFVIGFVMAIALMDPLDRLSLGDDVAESLGTRPRMIRLGAGIAAALLASAAAAIAGLLGFLGLLVPHAVRLAGGTSAHRYVVPASALAGATLLVIGDTLARILFAPVELPVGPMMVLLGVPLFLYLLRRAV